MADKQRRKPARWRKARNPDAGGRWGTPMNNAIWYRDHGRDRELWRGDDHLATAKPGGSWRVHCGSGDGGQEHSLAEAMQVAKARAIYLEVY